MEKAVFYPLGDSAIVIQFDEVISPEIHQQVRAVATHLDEYAFDGFLEYTPAFTSVTVYYQPWVIDYLTIKSLLEEMLEDLMEAVEMPDSTIIEIPVVYGGDRGPDLDFVARQHQLSTTEVIALHSAAEYVVYMIGFAPGFPYLGGMSEKITAPRKEKPRAVIPAGSVGIAGLQTGIYPIETPGGWQIIGQTPLQLFKVNRETPALLKAGDRLRFVAITETEFKKIKKK
ncbi:5-oxoprolinase subunit PxpB [Pedobacter sp. N36a]|uniref:5-oxoprolinase subunit PxpB n=1 Tax=Pedobacter sp. N36a TaxID=2767996 RepID=UPI0016574BD7|nr:5-oxoprolinase subunit PxpB [Pedobacter sp. N36a]MBC8986722.1 5-oxoprolinase subunit PxpB [Pedobacter sp. N36a]